MVAQDPRVGRRTLKRLESMALGEVIVLIAHAAPSASRGCFLGVGGYLQGAVSYAKKVYSSRRKMGPQTMAEQ